jgi:hypothetical protein
MFYLETLPTATVIQSDWWMNKTSVYSTGVLSLLYECRSENNFSMCKLGFYFPALSRPVQIYYRFKPNTVIAVCLQYYIIIIIIL